MDVAKNFLQLFYGANSSPGPNHGNYRNKEFDALYEQVRIMPAAGRSVRGGNTDAGFPLSRE